MKTKYIQKLVFSAMLASLVFTATWISIPNGLGGNINLGDSMLLLGAWMLGGPWSAVACALGAMLTDLLGGYAVYAPATFVIKALMVGAVLVIERLLRRMPVMPRACLSGVCAECVMVLGYFVYETCIFSLPVAAMGIPFNLIQGGASILVATLLRVLLIKARLDQLMK
ncbi:MAG: ECF transporter S component [Clostridia bacterium]|nr:ECF transporter S component [Clostridia bacterium]